MALDDDIPNVVIIDVQPGSFEYLINGQAFSLPITSGESTIHMRVLGGHHSDQIMMTGGHLSSSSADGFVAPGYFWAEFHLQEGDDVLKNDTANDTLVEAGKGDDVCHGGSGLDAFRGGPGNDELNGGGGNDFLMGDAGQDFMNGGPGNDWLYGYRLLDGQYSRPDSNIDLMVGGPGSDLFFYQHYKWGWVGTGPLYSWQKIVQETEDVMDFMEKEGDQLRQIETLAYNYQKVDPDDRKLSGKVQKMGSAREEAGKVSKK